MNSQTPYPFHVFDSIINGELRPHLQANKDELRVGELYQQAIIKELAALKRHLKSSKPKLGSLRLQIGGHPHIQGPFIRYKHIASTPGDEFSLRIHDNHKIMVSIPDRLDNLIDIDLPDPFDPVTGYYLFLVEREYSRLEQQFRQMLVAPSAPLKRYSRANLQLLKQLAGQARVYYKRIMEAGNTDWLKDAPYYIIYVVCVYLERSILLAQELYAPFLNHPLLSYEQVHYLCFGPSRLSAAFSPEPTERVLAMVRERKGYENTADKPLEQQEQADGQPPKKKKKSPYPIHNWSQLFNVPEDAEYVLQKLKEDKCISDAGEWLTEPSQYYMIALYNVLKARGYLKNTPMSAETLNYVFNQQFRKDFGARNWRPNQRLIANIVDREERFGLIPSYPPPRKKK